MLSDLTVEDLPLPNVLFRYGDNESTDYEYQPGPAELGLVPKIV